MRWRVDLPPRAPATHHRPRPSSIRRPLHVRHARVLQVRRLIGVEIPTRIARTTVAYWRCDAEASRTYAASAPFPVLIDYDDPMVYGLPILEKPRLIKMCRHDGPTIGAPEERDGEARAIAVLSWRHTG